MRPSQLSIQAFGPFSQCETIDFDALGEHPLFLINGPTGAGKSSILDAICFALYGQTTGKDREASQMRCDHSPDALLTEVTLAFELSGKRYRVYRCPTQQKPKSRGEGTTTHQTEARLWQLSGSKEQLMVAKSASETSKEIERLTGLNVEQFRQVMVLPQGKFRDFLMADSQQRELIFSKLFQTQIYKRIEDALKAKSLEIKQQKEQLKNQSLGLLQSAQLDDIEQLQLEQQTLAPKLLEAQATRDQHQTQVEQSQQQLNNAKQQQGQFEQLAILKTSMDELIQQKQQMDEHTLLLERAQQAKAIAHEFEKQHELSTEAHKAKAQVTQLRHQHQQLQHASEQAMAAFNRAKQAAETIPQLQTQLHDLEQMKPKVLTLSEIAKAIALQKKSYQSHQEQLEQQITAKTTNKQEKTTVEASLASMRQEVAPLAQLKEQRQQLHFWGKERAELDQAENRLTAIQASLQASSKDVDQAQLNVNQIQTRLTNLEMHWHLNQARALASQLQDHTPCPVCGSLEHPNPAHRLPSQDTSSEVSREQIEATKGQLEAAQQALSQRHQKHTVLTTEQNHIQQQIKHRSTNLGEQVALATADLRQQWQQCDQKIKRLDALIPAIETSETKLQHLSQRETEHEQQIQAQQSQLQQVEIALKEQQQSLHLMEQQVQPEFRDTQALDLKITGITSDLAQLQKTLADTDNEQQASATRLSSHAATLSATEQQAQQTQSQFEAQTLHWSSLLEQSPFTDEDAFKQAHQDEALIKSLASTLADYQQTVSVTQGKLLQQQALLNGIPQPNIEQRSRTLANDQAQLNQAQQAWQQLQQRHGQLNELQTMLNESQAAQQALDDKYTVYGTLSEVANGQTGNKISLQRFVLSVLLDDVLREASNRLHHMSKGRYQLLRKEEKAKGNKASGLELEVEDAYTGRNRAVSTLSGGESFMAALSLALGLSDVVQAYSGGIHLDTLFIDEGFGSLDQESLDLAIKTLTDLQATGRMIGIISHVSELKEQMPLRVDVLSRNNGSVIQQA